LKAEIEELLKLLDEAHNLASQYTGGYSSGYHGEILFAEDFHPILKDSIKNLKQGNLEEIKKLHFFFFPGNAWDAFTGREGMDLGNNIFKILSNLKLKASS